VGCHHGNTRPLGRLANKELRSWKIRAHTAFDRLWKSRRMKREQAYAWLAEKLGISKKECHIAMFDKAMCQRTIALSNELMFKGVTHETRERTTTMPSLSHGPGKSR
jgi:hypothetical protein